MQNNSSGVIIELCGTDENIKAFMERLIEEAPPLAMIQAIEVVCEDDVPEGLKDFTIRTSEKQEIQQVLIPPDIATCDDCLREMRDPGDKRYRYPFINCTNCGPRYTIIKGLPTIGRKLPWLVFPCVRIVAGISRCDR